MAGRTILQRLDFPIVHEGFAFHFLLLRVLFRVVAPFPVQIGDFFRRAQLRGGISVAIEAESHAKRLIVINLLHLVDLAVALHATDATIYVNGVIEINVVRHAMNLHPGNRFAGCSAFTDQGEARIIFQHLIVAIHAGGTRGNIRIPGFLDSIVAVTAIDSELAVVSGVGESDGLNRLIANAGVFGSEIIPGAGDKRATNEDDADDDHHRQTVRPLWKNC